MNPFERSAPRTLEPIPLETLSKRPLISILVANYNYAAYLPETIESVLAQSYDRWELIICDDGSTDNSIEVIERFVRLDKRIQLVRKRNGGHASGLNSAFSRARGEIVCLLDSDDLFTPDKLEQVADCAARNPASGLIVHRVIRVTSTRQRQGVWPLSGALPEGWCGPGLFKGGGIVPYMPPTSGLSLRREAALRLFPLSTEPPLHMCPDQVIMRLAPLVTPIANTKEALAEQRLHQTNTYGKARITATSIGRDIDLARALWREQKRFLSAIDEGLAGEFEPIEGTEYLLFLLYVKAKLTGDGEIRSCFERFIRSLREDPKRKHYWLWRASIYFPRTLLDKTVNVLYGQSTLKQWVWCLNRLASFRKGSAIEP